MKEKNKILIVNLITLTRILGTFLLPIIVYYANPLGITIYVSCILLTDLIDGKLARKWKVSTVFGATLDAFSDKVLGIAILLYLFTIYTSMIIPTIFECLIAINNTRGILKGVNIQSTKLGKIKTCFLGATSALAVLSTLLKSKILIIIIQSLLILTAIIQLVVLYEYYKKVKEYSKKYPESKISLKKLKANLKKGNELKEALFSPKYFKENINISLLDKLTNKKTRKAKA